jgi:hypothetical protein
MKFKDLNKIKNGIVKIGTTIILIFSISLNSIFISFGNVNYSNNTQIQILNEVNEKVKTQNGFTLLENQKDVKNWLAKQKVSRKITKLQVHHMDLPNYSTWEKTDKKLFSEPHFGRTQSLDSYGKSKWGSGASDGHGHHIAQHFNVFPDGKITTGRNLNSTPIGIRGWNTGAICIEIYGCFDKGHDKMSSAQKEAVIYLYGELCKRFDIPVNTTHIRPHCWFTAGGTYLGKYNPNRSAKTCPGTNFWGVGCSPEGFAKFIADIKNYVNGKGIKVPVIKKVDRTGEKDVPNYTVQVITDTLNVRYGASTSYDKISTLKKGDKVVITHEKDGWGLIQGAKGWISLNDKYVKKVKVKKDDEVKKDTDTKKDEEKNETTFYRVVTGSYSDRDNAIVEQDKLKKLGYDAFLVTAEVNKKIIFRVVAESFEDKKDAENLIAQLKKKGYDPFIVIYVKNNKN